jgi:hypothetical protein
MSIPAAKVALAAMLLPMLPIGAQLPPAEGHHERPRMKQSQVDALLKSDHEKSLEDAIRLFELAEELKNDLENKDRHVLSLSAFKKAEEIEKLAKRIRGRMKRF